MNKTEIEYKSLIYIINIAYIGNILCGACGWLCIEGSKEQFLLFQIGSAFAITASVMAGRYTGLRGQHVAASAYILLGITHGISLAAISRIGINVERGLTMVMPMIPALICMFWCSIYPLWLRLSAIIPVFFFVMVYVNVETGSEYFSWPLQAGYGLLQLTEVLWGIFMWMDYRKTLLYPPAQP